MERPKEKEKKEGTEVRRVAAFFEGRERESKDTENGAPHGLIPSESEI